LGYRGPFVTVPHGVTVPEAGTWDGGSGGYLLWYGRYDVDHKGLDVLLRALATMPAAERPPLRMHGPDYRGGRAEVLDLVAALGLGAYVEVRGPVYGDAKEEVLARASAFVYPSRWDSHSVAVTEALARGVPCLVARPMHIGRALDAEGAGIVVELDPMSLAAGIRRALSDEGARVGAAGRELCLRELRWDRCAARFLAQLGVALGGGSGG
jgi:glycosyltransferase involved in cell wall biosynthesis